MTPQLVALDWGTSSLRAWLLGPGGTVLAEKTAPLGILKVLDGDFAAAFRAVCGDWLAHGVPAIASGMIGSRQGWVEAPYVPCPAGFEALARRLARVDAAGVRLGIVPGVSCVGDGVPDVMRGEETQVFGALDAPEGTHVLPGTHSKWVRVAAGQIGSFATYMTGEVFAVLREHSILGRLMPPGAAPHSSAAFRRGWKTSLDAEASLLRRLFGARTLGLFGPLAAEEVSSYLSGLLIGDEVRAALRDLDGASVTLIGDPVLCERYREVLAARGIAASVAPPDAARVGLWRIAVESGLVPGGRGRD